MKTILKFFIVQLFLLPLGSIYAQVGVGTTTPDLSSALDISSTSQGLLMPRLTTTQRDAIVSPAKGLIIYNITSNDGELNIGNPSTPKWIGIKSQETPMMYSVTEGADVSTESTSELLVTGMNVSCAPGTYIASFNAQHTGVEGHAFSSDQGVLDLVDIYDDLIALPGGVPHVVAFGSGEVLTPGVYDVTGAFSVTGSLILDGGGDSTSLFVIRGNGAFSAAANSNIILQGEAEARNIFWVSTDAMTISAYSSMKGTLVSNAGAINMAADSSLKGRMFTKTGAIGVGSNSVLTIPSGESVIDLRSLSSFVMFSTNGALTSDVTSIITGDVGNGLGDLTLAGAHYGNQYPAGTEPVTGTEMTTYSFYQNGVEIVNSSRIINSLSSVVSLQAMLTLTAQEDVEVRWKVGAGEATLDNRNLSLIRSEN
ncbi:MAG: hypothetical protein ACI9SJ_001855 [Flavobacteriaceae bacterium]|jgi:hypothetical protein|uniref:ice-binding family protein n=1 Tax=Candidatus Marifrigoribacter sp. Uisw_064 TaxID=3230970 RepID=UPI003AED0B8B